MPLIAILPIAILPMYDWPEIRQATDQYYESLKVALSAFGFKPPDSLLHDQDDLHEIWQAKNLLIGQTCGLPYVRFLQGKVTHIGSPVYDNACNPGFYKSVVVARKRYTLDTLRKLKFGCNGFDSQSGYMCLQHHMKAQGLDYINPDEITITGSHRQSIRAILAGEIDYAAIDNITWQLALRHETECNQLHVVAGTCERPTLPYISSIKNKKKSDILGQAIQTSIQNLEPETKSALLISGFIPDTQSRYRMIKENAEAVTASTA